MKFSTLANIFLVTFVIGITVFISSMIAVSNHNDQHTESHKLQSLRAAPKSVHHYLEQIDAILASTVTSNADHNVSYDDAINPHQFHFSRFKMPNISSFQPWQFHVPELVHSLENRIVNASHNLHVAENVHSLESKIANASYNLHVPEFVHRIESTIERAEKSLIDVIANHHLPIDEQEEEEQQREVEKEEVGTGNSFAITDNSAKQIVAATSVTNGVKLGNIHPAVVHGGGVSSEQGDNVQLREGTTSSINVVDGVSKSASSTSSHIPSLTKDSPLTISTHETGLISKNQDSTKKQQQQPQQLTPTNQHPAIPDLVMEHELNDESHGDELTCAASFPPKCEMYPYVRFWNKRFYPEDCYSSPARHHLKEQAPFRERKYLLFQPDLGGWNNIRMAAETAIILAHATGRTLVMPPDREWYLLNKNKDKNKDKSTFSKFFDLDKVAEGLDMIDMETFLSNVAANGLLKKLIPTEYTASSLAKKDTVLFEYLEEACFTHTWEPGKMFFGLNITTEVTHQPPGSLKQDRFRHQKVKYLQPNRTINPTSANHQSWLVPVLGKCTSDRKQHRYNLMVAHGRALYPYNEKLFDERAIFFPGDYRNEYRILTHFYTYIYFEQYHTEQIYKRIVRDRLHYHDDIFCAAGKIIKMIHADAAALYDGPDDGTYRNQVQSASFGDYRTMGGNTNMNATYFAYHIRRGDFQYKEYNRMPAEEIRDNTADLLPSNVTRLIYISTDEKKKEFFNPLTAGGRYELRFLDDYIKKSGVVDSKDFNNNHIGMIEQVICANAHTFIGTPLSTFTGYITRMRGYYRDGRYNRTFYDAKKVIHQLQTRREIVGPFWAREFEVASKDIDDYFTTEDRGQPHRKQEQGVSAGKST